MSTPVGAFLQFRQTFLTDAISIHNLGLPARDDQRRVDCQYHGRWKFCQDASPFWRQAFCVLPAWLLWIGWFCSLFCSLFLLLLYGSSQPPRWMSLVWKDLWLTGHLVCGTGILPKSLRHNDLQCGQIARNNLKGFQSFSKSLLSKDLRFAGQPPAT